VGLVVLAIPSSAGAATQLGETFTPSVNNCGTNTFLQSGWPGPPYAAPFAGVITSWSHQASASPPPLKFKVGRHAVGNNFTIVGESGIETLAPGMLNTFPARIPVQAGDLIGFYVGAAAPCAQLMSPGYEHQFRMGDTAQSTTAAFSPAMNVRLDISASLEPDADSDGFGDETQDCDPTDPARAEDCAAPNATITKRPKNKTKKKKATFEFTGTDTRAISGFQCKLDATPFAPCTSPTPSR
jgi:hypothetical protein